MFSPPPSYLAQATPSPLLPPSQVRQQVEALWASGEASRIIAKKQAERTLDW